MSLSLLPCASKAAISRQQISSLLQAFLMLCSLSCADLVLIKAQNAVNPFGLTSILTKSKGNICHDKPWFGLLPLPYVSLVTIFIFNNKSSRTHSTAPPFPKKSNDFLGAPMDNNIMYNKKAKKKTTGRTCSVHQMVLQVFNWLQRGK